MRLHGPWGWDATGRATIHGRSARGQTGAGAWLAGVVGRQGAQSDAKA